MIGIAELCFYSITCGEHTAFLREVTLSCESAHPITTSSELNVQFFRLSSSLSSSVVVSARLLLADVQTTLLYSILFRYKTLTRNDVSTKEGRASQPEPVLDGYIQKLSLPRLVFRFDVLV